MGVVETDARGGVVRACDGLGHVGPERDDVQDSAPGYPGAPRVGTPLLVPDDLGADVVVFHAGTRLEAGRLVSAGGRVLNVVALGSDVAQAVARAYGATSRIGFADAHYRRDIGSRLAPA